jgi:hypothetical protein
VTYKLFAVTPWNGLPAASATSATAGAADSKYSPKLAANDELAAPTSINCVGCCSGHRWTLLLCLLPFWAVAEHMWLFISKAGPMGLCTPHAILDCVESIIVWLYAALTTIGGVDVVVEDLVVVLLTVSYCCQMGKLELHSGVIRR